MPFQMRFSTLFTLLLSLIVPAGSASADMCFNFENFYNFPDTVFQGYLRNATYYDNRTGTYKKQIRMGMWMEFSA